MPLPKVSLQVLEVFERVAQVGSMRRAARDMGLSISSVSHHVARLEEELGATLVDRSSRPFTLTREGREALHHLSSGLQHLRQATSETAIGGVLGARSLRIGIVEDLESNVSPELAVILAGRMPHAKLSIRHVLSHEAPALLQRDDLDVAIAAEAGDSAADILADPLLRDPYVIAAPAGSTASADELMSGAGDLPFLRFNKDHLIGKQIEAHLSRNRITLPARYAFDSVQSIMAVIANGDGWSILTPLGFARAQRFAPRVKLFALPIAAFARRICLMSRSDFDRRTAIAMASLVRQSVQRAAVDTVCGDHPWLDGVFVCLGPENEVR